MDKKELFQLHDGRTVLDEDVSKILFKLKEIKPEENAPDRDNYSWNEAGMSVLFSQCYMDKVRYCIQFKSWYTYTNGKWDRDEGGIQVAGHIRDFYRIMAVYCGEIEKEDLRSNYMKFISKMGDRRFRDRLMKDAMQLMAIDANEFDKNPFLINCKNGTFDLKNKVFREHRYQDLITYQTRFSLDKEMYTSLKFPRWEKFIKEITEYDSEKEDYLQRALGYSLLGLAREECMFILYGKTTRNGKSTMLNAIQYLLGDYSDVASATLICKTHDNDSSGANPQMAKLKGKRFVTMSESSKYGHLDESAIKQMTGGEDLTCRNLYQAPITFNPQFKLWLSCNDLPDVRDRSLFASERLRVIEFNRHFSQEEQDKNLKDIFRSEEAMAGIFMWLVIGYIHYTKQGLRISDRLKLADKQYATSTDAVLQYLQEECEVDPSFSISQKDLYNNYKSWARSRGMKEMSAKTFHAEVRLHTDWYEKESVSAGIATYKGLKRKEIV